jgi:hypothetical protein
MMKKMPCQCQWLMPVNPSYSGGRDQKDHCLKPAQAKFKRPYLEKTHQQKKG